MEEWLSTRDEASETALALMHSNGASLNNMIAILYDKAEAHQDKKKTYALLYSFAMTLYHGIPCARTAALAQALYSLEDGMGPFPDLTADLNEAEQLRRLAILDAGRVRFKQELLRVFRVLPTFSDRNYVIGWARLCYNHVHRFQAPTTPNLQRAMQDANGETDHFGELIQEVIQESTPATTE